MFLAAAPQITAAPAHAAPSPVMALPFALLLAAIAIAPFIDRHWWERHYAKVSVALGAISAGYYLVWLKDYARLQHIGMEYVSFISLIGSLYVVAGGIHIGVKGQATPLANAAFLCVGGLLANVIGTTGASMLLIRPYIRMNRQRISAFHVVFFIFIVSNIAGCLTPIGDPPLFMGFLKGVPFWWVLEHCWQGWIVGVGLTLAVFYMFDRRSYAKAAPSLRENATPEEIWRFDGLQNVGFLIVILAALFIPRPAGLREAILIAAAFCSYQTTPRRIHEANQFEFHPIQEVGWLFVGIFLTMAPLLDYLTVHAPRLGIDTETEFYWLTGVLSGLLDNAPTYLAFLATALGNHGLSFDRPNDMATFMADHDHHLMAISLASVFFGAMTYIGNGPNFMVKAIAEQAGVKTPNFFNYLWRYSLPILLPIFLLVWILFFSPWGVF
jgi:Na+/H+ antiporter NhaD/arsenite permease-like protein